MLRPVRRLIICLLGVIAAIALPAGSAAAAPALTEARAQKIGTDAYVYGIALLEFERQQQTQTSVAVPNTLSDTPINQLGNARNLTPRPRTCLLRHWRGYRQRPRAAPPRSSRSELESSSPQSPDITAGTSHRPTSATSGLTTTSGRSSPSTASRPTSRSKRCTRSAASMARRGCQRREQVRDPHPAGGFPPAKYFWSFTAYDKDLFLIPNPINRYVINRFTPGVKYNADGSLDIYVQSTPPAGHQSNWLRSTSSGQFEVIMRRYGPKRSALNDSYQYPPITKVG